MVGLLLSTYGGVHLQGSQMKESLGGLCKCAQSLAQLVESRTSMMLHLLPTPELLLLNANDVAAQSASTPL
jgi:hypothetical protein